MALDTDKALLMFAASTIGMIKGIMFQQQKGLISADEALKQIKDVTEAWIRIAQAKK